MHSGAIEIPSAKCNIGHQKVSASSVEIHPEISVLCPGSSCQIHFVNMFLFLFFLAVPELPDLEIVIFKWNF